MQVCSAGTGHCWELLASEPGCPVLPLHRSPSCWDRWSPTAGVCCPFLNVFSAAEGLRFFPPVPLLALDHPCCQICVVSPSAHSPSRCPGEWLQQWLRVPGCLRGGTAPSTWYSLNPSPFRRRRGRDWRASGRSRRLRNRGRRKWRRRRDGVRQK